MGERTAKRSTKPILHVGLDVHKESIAIAVYRVLALLNVAIYDATVAAWDAKYLYNSSAPLRS